MQTHSASKSAEPSKPPAFFSVQPQREPAFFSQSELQMPDVVQRKCSTCDETDDKVQRQIASEDESLQRKCSTCASDDKLQRQEESAEEESPQRKTEAPLQSGLHITPPDDPQEREADQMADMVMRMPATEAEPGSMIGAAGHDGVGAVQRKCDECSIDSASGDEQAEDKDPYDPDAEKSNDAGAGAGGDSDTVSPKSERGERAPVPPGLHMALRSSRGGGRPMPPPLRASMERRFGQDFSAVRIHADSTSAAMTRSIHAQAFTYGSDIFFNPHRFDPVSTTGQTLLAHELTHVIQQKGAHPLQRKIQRAEEARLGNWAHMKVQEQIRKSDTNLITEGGIAGATRHSVKINVAGYTDFFKTPGNVLPGVQANIVGADGDVTDVKYTYKNFLAGGERAKKIRPEKTQIGPRVRKDKTWDFTHNLPKSFEVAELKPLFPTDFTESMAYHGTAWVQVDGYIRGYENFIKQAHADIGSPIPSDPKGKPLDITEAQIPDAINYRKFVQERDHKNDGTILKKSTYLAPEETTPRVWIYRVEPGVLVYFLISHPFSKKAFRPGLDAQLQSLTPLVKEVKEGKAAPMGTSIDSKREPGVPTISRKGGKRIQAKGEEWDKQADTWEKKRKVWVQGGGTKEKPKKFLKEQARGVEKKAKVDKKLKLSVSKAEKDEAKNVRDVRFWSSFKGRIFGALYFRFRKVFVKIEELFAKIKAKFKKHRDNAALLNNKAGIFDNWKKVATKVIIRMAVEIFKDMVAIAFTGFMNCINAIIDSITGKFVKKIEEEAHDKLKEVQPLCCGIMEFKHKLDAEVEKHEKVITEFTEAVHTIRKWQEILNDVETAVRIGVQVVSCGLPPGLGCLWGLVAQLGISGGLSLLTRTSYFDDYIAKPAANALMDAIVGDKLHNLMVDVLEASPLKEHMKGLGACSRRYRGAGGGGGNGIGGHLDQLDPNDPAIVKARQEWEAQHKDEILKDLQEVFEKGDKTPMSQEEIQKLVDALKNSKKTPEELKKMLRVGRNPKTGKFDFDKALAQVSSDTVPEDAAPKERKIDYKTAEKQNAYYAQKIKWTTTTFIKVPGTQPDSKEFAEAVYDMQQAIGAHADGIAGPDTTMKFYDTNKLTKDKAYAAAQKTGQEEADARARNKAIEENRKQVDALLKDEKIKAAFDKGFPPDSELKKDLLALTWTNLDDESMQFINRNGRFIVGIKTEAGHSLGAYFHYVEREFQGQKMNMIVVTSKFYAVDEIGANESLSLGVTFDNRTTGLEFIYLAPQKKDTFFKMRPIFFGRFVDIQ